MIPLRRVFVLNRIELVLCDSITQVTDDDAGRIVVSGSHGGSSSACFAAVVPAMLYVFNDAGFGKDGAGIAGLKLLSEAGIAAVSVSHDSARIGEAEDSLANGIVSMCNREAHALGLRTGEALTEALFRLTE